MGVADGLFDGSFGIPPIAMFKTLIQGSECRYGLFNPNRELQRNVSKFHARLHVHSL